MNTNFLGGVEPQITPMNADEERQRNERQGNGSEEGDLLQIIHLALGIANLRDGEDWGAKEDKFAPPYWVSFMTGDWKVARTRRLESLRYSRSALP